MVETRAKIANGPDQGKEHAMTKLHIEEEFANADIEERKRIIAHQLWEDEGRPEGMAEKHWEQANLFMMAAANGEEQTIPPWLKPQDESSVVRSSIEAHTAELQTKLGAESTKQPAEPLTSMEEIKNRILRRSAA